MTKKHRKNMGSFQVKIRISPDFRKELEAARPDGMTMNEYLVFCLTHMRVPDRSYNAAVKELSHINQDMARLGNILNHALFEPTLAANRDAIVGVLGEISDLKSALKDAARKLVR